MIASLVFYMFALALIFSATMTVTARQPVHAVLFLIWSFFNGAGLFLTMGAEFLAFIILIVYIGAVAVLFLFVVMMLDVKGQAPGTSSRLKRTLPIGLGVGGALLAQMLAVAQAWPQAKASLPDAALSPLSNTKALGLVLYTDYLYPFELCGLILLVAMVGAISLTLREKERQDVKRQKLWTQLDRSRQDAVEIRKVEKGEGAL